MCSVVERWVCVMLEVSGLNLNLYKCAFFLEKLYLIVEELVGRDIYFLCYFDFFSNFYFLEIDF